MKTNFLLSLTALLSAIMLAGCAEKPKELPENKYLGKLSSIYAVEDQQEARLIAKREKLTESSKEVDVEKMKDIDAERKTLSEETKKSLDAEYIRIAGTELPYTLSEDLLASNPWYKITMAPKITADGTCIFSEATTQEFDCGEWGNMECRVYSKCVNSKGEALSTNVTMPLSVMKGVIPSGTTIEGSKISVLPILREPEHWVDFTQVVFCTGDEYQLANSEIASRRKAQQKAIRDEKKIMK